MDLKLVLDRPMRDCLPASSIVIVSFRDVELLVVFVHPSYMRATTPVNPLSIIMRRGLVAAACSACCILLLSLPSLVDSKSILGIDLGSLYMKVALVRRNSPLEIVTNMHSKRKTEQMVLFDSGSRFYGADASSLLARKPHLTPTQMSVLLGRSATHPAVTSLVNDRHYFFTPEYNETRSGVCLTVDGDTYTPEEMVAMVLTHAREISAIFNDSPSSPPSDCVLTVPCFYTQHERRALLDAAALAGLNVLALVNENTAAALHFGIDRIDEKPVTYLFYNMGANSLQVSVVRYLSYPRKDTKYAKEKTVGGFEVLSTAWDATLGGATFDARLVDYMANEFNVVWNEKKGTKDKDVRQFPKSMAKLMIQANKVKEILSANSEMPVFIDALQDDVNYQSHISRAKFEEICHDLLKRASDPITAALKMANVTLDELDAVELIGGGMRVPKVQEAVGLAISGGAKAIELGMHLNSDESMALGAAFHGANVSAAFKVRHVGMADVNSFPISVDVTDIDAENRAGIIGGLFGIGKKKDVPKVADDVWAKHATIFKLGSKLGSKKTIAFSHEKDIHVALDYDEESELLPTSTDISIEQYNVSGIAEFAAEMVKKELGIPKVSLQFELDSSGLTRLLKAEAVVEETVMVDEEIEVPDDEADNATVDDAKADGKDDVTDDAKVEDDAKLDDTNKTEGGVKNETVDDLVNATDKEKTDAKNATAATKKKKKTKIITVQKEKKKKHVRNLKIASYHVGVIRPYSPDLMAESKAKLDTLAQADKERTMLEEARNDYEAYIYYIRNKLVDHEEEIAKVTSEEQREAIKKSAEEAEEWLFDEGYSADLKTFQAKHVELSTPMDKAMFRMSELTARPKAIDELTKQLNIIEELMTQWETTMTHITEEERTEVLDKVKVAKKWIEEKVGEQEKADVTAEPVFTSKEVPGQLKSLIKIVERLKKKPRPKPIVKKNETDSTEKNETESSENTTTNSTEEDSKTSEETASVDEKTEGEDTEKDGGAKVTDDEL